MPNREERIAAYADRAVTVVHGATIPEGLAALALAMLALCERLGAKDKPTALALLEPLLGHLVGEVASSPDGVIWQ